MWVQHVPEFKWRWPVGFLLQFSSSTKEERTKSKLRHKDPCYFHKGHSRFPESLLCFLLQYATWWIYIFSMRVKYTDLIMTNLAYWKAEITLPTKVRLVKAVVFPVVMCGCESWDHQEGWALKNWCFWTVVLEKTLESPLDCKEIQPVHPKGNQSWIFIGRTDAEPETPILWPPDVKNWLIWKTLMLGKIEGGGEGRTEDEMVGWHHQLNGQEFG